MMLNRILYKSGLLTIVVLAVMCCYAHGQKTLHPPGDDCVVEKVKTAMLCMQRYSWEHGTAMQGMFEIGDSTSLVIMAREALQRSAPDGRLAMVGSEMNIADPGVNIPGTSTEGQAFFLMMEGAVRKLMNTQNE